MKKSILSIGEIIWDVYPDRKTLGGAPLNFAAHSARCGAQSYILSAVGTDPLGEEARGIIEASGVRCDYLGVSGYPTGRCDVTLGADGVPAYKVAVDTAYDNISLSEGEIEKLCSRYFDALYFGTLIQRSDTTRRLLRHICDLCAFQEVICDVNLRDGCYDADSALYCLRSATILKISDEEEPKLREMGLYRCKDPSAEAVARCICREYPNVKILLLTMGDKGALAYCAKSGEAHYTPAVPANVASTVGAGDSFLAAWCTAYMSGESIEAASERAAVLSSFVVSRKEAVPEYEIRDGVFVF